MNATADERLVVMLEARISEFEKRMKKAEQTGTGSYTRLRRGSRSATAGMEADMLRSTARINQAMAATSTKIGSFGRTMLVGLASGAVLGGITALTSGLHRTVSAIADIGDQAKRAGMGVEQFQRWAAVADQNRIGIEQMTDGLKELQLRTDEFVVTGGGAAAEAFQRMGFSASELRQKLKDPSKLMLEIIGRLEGMDKAAQIRISDEIFGGSAGERFVELLDQGEAGIRRIMQNASVVSEEQIAKAQELDRRYKALTTSMANGWKALAVEIANTVAGLLQFNNEARRLEDLKLFKDGAGAREILGDGFVDGVEAGKVVVADFAELLSELMDEYQRVSGNAVRLTAIMENFANELRRSGDEAGALSLEAAVAEFKALEKEIDANTISAEDFDSRMQEAVDTAVSALSAIEDLDQKPKFGRLIQLLGNVGTALDTLREKALQVRAALPGNTDTGMAGYGVDPHAGNEGWAAPTGLAPTTSIAPRRAPPMVHENLPPDKKAGGGSKGLEGYAKLVEKTRADIAALDAEAAEFLAVATSGTRVGDAMAYAEKRAELLAAALAEGKELTPGLRAEIDQLAASYATAGEEAEAAREKLERIAEATQRGEDAFGSFFESILDGADSARDALSNLLAEMARAQFRAGMLGLLKAVPGGGKLIETVGSLLAGREGGGPVRGGTPYLVNERTPNSEVFVPSQSGAVLNVPQAQAALRQTTARQESSGGTVSNTLNFNIDAKGAQEGVARQIEDAMRSVAPQIIKASVSATFKQMRESKRRWQ